MSNEDSVVKCDESVIIPASITTIPNLSFEPSGSVEVSSLGGIQSRTSFYSFETSWNVLGDLEIDLETSWNVGEGAYYWYRVESECGSVTCDEFGIERRECERMTLITTVSARNVAELCEILGNPRVNAPLTVRISSIRRYGRPMFRDQIQPDQCNTLDEVEFCHIPECLDYCVDEEESSFLSLSEESPEQALESSLTLMDTDGIPASNASVQAVVVESGYEQDFESSLLPISPSVDQIAFCGCARVPTSMPIAHSLGSSSALSRFLARGESELPAMLNLAYRSNDSLWSSSIHLKSVNETWILSLSLSCRSDLWSFLLSVRGASRKTVLSFDVPPELFCPSGRPSSSIECYFRPQDNRPPPRVIQVISPPRSPVPPIIDEVEVFVDGIFVPYTVYYDELGLFADSYWGSTPLRIGVNRPSPGRTRTMTLEGIA